MPFNTALSGLRAASGQLNVIGNNIANASTVGFKESRAEFTDVYASSSIGTTGLSIGSGVEMAKIAQQFTQGNISFTENALDLAINGDGFFTLQQNGTQVFSRAGQFSIDRDGFIVNPQGASLQGFPADSSGAVAVTLGDLQVTVDTINPQQTTSVTGALNLNAGADVLAVRGSRAETQGTSISVPSVGGTNSYPSETITVTDPNGGIASVTTSANSTAGAIASLFSAQQGVTGSATTTAQVTGFTNPGGATTILLNGVDVTADNINDLAININNLSNTTLGGISASVNAGVLTVASNNGNDLRFAVNAVGTASFNVDGVVAGSAVGAPQTVSGGGNTQVTVGGVVTLTLDENYSLGTGAGQIFNAGAITQVAFVNNAFDPNVASTYNDATSVTIFDSLGNSHVLTQYFVKEPTINSWTMYVQIDGQDVGDPNTALPPPANTQATRAAYDLVFNNDGTLNLTASDQVLVSYWNPIDSAGNPTGALLPLPVANGGTLPIPEPAVSSNFFVNLNGTTQYGADFAVNRISQNGYTSGRLSTIDISDGGDMLARFTNGQSQLLGRVALANFANEQGLRPLGGTGWAESFESGQPVIGNPGTASLGTVQASALEESNVDLSAELVDLIIAQRNFQANAKTVQTADTVTQTIINLR